jgi:hypothetical protein
MTQPFQHSLVRFNTGWRNFFKHLTRPHDDVVLSIQAHDGAYCSPRVDNLPGTGYSSFELAAFEKSDDGGRDGDWLSPSGLEVWSYSDDVAGYVDAADVQRVVDYFLAGGEFTRHDSHLSRFRDEEDDGDEDELTDEAKSWLAFVEGK